MKCPRPTTREEERFDPGEKLEIDEPGPTSGEAPFIQGVDVGGEGVPGHS